MCLHKLILLSPSIWADVNAVCKLHPSQLLILPVEALSNKSSSCWNLAVAGKSSRITWVRYWRSVWVPSVHFILDTCNTNHNSLLNSTKKETFEKDNNLEIEAHWKDTFSIQVSRKDIWHSRYQIEAQSEDVGKQKQAKQSWSFINFTPVQTIEVNQAINEDWVGKIAFKTKNCLLALK